jgi:PAS domain S-box-containing protein
MRVRDAWKTWMGAVLRHRIGRIALAPVLLGLALPPSLFLHAKLPHGEEYLFLAAVVATAWLGGWVPGLLSAVLAPFVLDYFFIPPLHTLDIGPREWPCLLPLLLSALVAAWVSSTRTASRKTQDLLRESEAKFRRILTNLPDIAWTWDATGRVVYISPKCEKTLGYTNQEIYSGGGQFFLGRVHPADLRRIQTAMDDMYLRGGGCNLEFRFHRKDDAWIWLHSRAVSYQVRGVSFADGVMSDISQRKHGEMELRAKTAFLEAQTNATIDGILVVDANGQRILQNRRFNEIFSIPRELLDSDDDAPVLEHVRRQVREPDRFFARVMHLYTHPDETGGDEIELVNGIFLERYTAPVRGGDGSYYGRIWTFRDITERRRNEDALRQLSAAVEQSPVSVVITDPRGDISYVNRKFTELTGYTAAEVLGKNPRILNLVRNRGWPGNDVLHPSADRARPGTRGEMRGSRPRHRSGPCHCPRRHRTPPRFAHLRKRSGPRHHIFHPPPDRVHRHCGAARRTCVPDGKFGWRVTDQPTTARVRNQKRMALHPGGPSLF